MLLLFGYLLDLNPIHSSCARLNETKTSIYCLARRDNDKSNNNVNAYNISDSNNKNNNNNKNNQNNRDTGVLVYWNNPSP